MKKMYYLLVAMLFMVASADTASANSLNYDITIKIRVRITYHCEGGFGFCRSIEIGRVSSTDPREVNAEAYLSGNNLIMEFSKEHLNEIITKEFEENQVIPIDEEIILSSGLTEYLKLPSNTILAEGRYRIINESEFFQITIPIVN
jgi:hypothetical protein